VAPRREPRHSLLSSSPPASTGTRAGAAVLALLLLVVLSLAAWLTPATAGFGTHRQLGLPPCTWARAFGRPCVTCGMTTSFSHAANLDVRASVLTQPMGFVLALLAATLVWPLLHVATTGSNVGTLILKCANGKSGVLLVVLLLAAWAYKVVTWG